MRCPVHLTDVDLFGPDAQEHWYEAYPILHREAPVLPLGPHGPAENDIEYLLPVPRVGGRQG